MLCLVVMSMLLLLAQLLSEQQAIACVKSSFDKSVVCPWTAVRNTVKHS